MQEYTIKINKHQTEWRKNGVLHREDGPAVECANGDKYYYQNGVLHREDGPAIIYSTGDMKWYRNNMLHREDGPAIIRRGGRINYWYLNDKEYSEKEYSEKTFDNLKSELKSWIGNPNPKDNNFNRKFDDWFNDYVDWFIRSEQEFQKKQSPCHGKIVEIDGKKYKLEAL